MASGYMLFPKALWCVDKESRAHADWQELDGNITGPGVGRPATGTPTSLAMWHSRSLGIPTPFPMETELWPNRQTLLHTKELRDFPKNLET
ncbi:hypothetical protein WJX77_004316 [Trebouxia sp. C0004]